MILGKMAVHPPLWVAGVLGGGDFLVIIFDLLKAAIDKETKTAKLCIISKLP